MGEWSVGQWIVGVMSFQKMYGLYGLKHHIVEISGDVTDAGRDGTSEYRATQLLICEKLSLATRPRTPWHVGPLKVGLLAINNHQNPPDQWAHQTNGPTRPTGQLDPQPTRSTGPTKHYANKT